MDKKQREYCIKLGNPYMKEDIEPKQEANSWNNNFEIPVEDDEENNWLKNTKNFTN